MEKITIPQMEALLAKQINSFRHRPSDHLPDLKKMLNQFQGKFLVCPDFKAKVKTHEGAQPVVEAMNYLAEAKSAPLMLRNRALDLTARDLTNYLEETGNFLPNSPEQKMSARVKKYVKEGGIYAENLVFGAIRPHNILNLFLASDGIPNRIYRKNLLNPTFTHFGLSIAQHPKMGYVAAVIFFGSKSKNQTEALNLYDQAYDPKIIPKVSNARSFNVTLLAQKNQFCYDFVLTNGQTVRKILQYKTKSG